MKKNSILLIAVIVLINHLSAQTFVDIFKSPGYPGVSETILSFYELWPSLTEHLSLNGYLHLLYGNGISVLSSDNNQLVFTDIKNDKYKIGFCDSPHKIEIGITSLQNSYIDKPLNYSPLVLCIPGNGFVYSIRSEVGFGMIVEKYELKNGICKIIEQPFYFFCQPSYQTFGNQNIYFESDFESEVIGITSDTVPVQIMGINNIESRNNSFSAWLLIKSKAGLSGWIYYQSKSNNFAG